MRMARRLEVTADVCLSRDFPTHIPMSSMSVKKAHFKAIEVCQCVVWYYITLCCGHTGKRGIKQTHRRGGTYLQPQRATQSRNLSTPTLLEGRIRVLHITYSI